MGERKRREGNWAGMKKKIGDMEGTKFYFLLMGLGTLAFCFLSLKIYLQVLL